MGTAPNTDLKSQDEIDHEQFVADYQRSLGLGLRVCYGIIVLCIVYLFLNFIPRTFL